RDNVKTPVVNKEPYFQVDPEFQGKTHLNDTATHRRYGGVSYSKRYELLCRRLVLQRLHTSDCFMMATNSRKTTITQPADDLNFQRFVASLRGHVVTFLGRRNEQRDRTSG
ncbi:MAG: PaeR7I family type II restriction endonuclease, partial [Nitrospirota bacterium]